MQKIAIILLVLGGCVVAGFWYIGAYGTDDAGDQAKNSPSISTYSECVAAGNPVMESYPEQCRGADGRIFVNTVPKDTSPTLPSKTGSEESGKETALAAVRAQAVKELGVEADAIDIVSVTAQEWPNGCLGLGDPDEMCTMMVTSGYEITLTAHGKTVVYRTNQTGTIVRKEQSL